MIGQTDKDQESTKQRENIRQSSFPCFFDLAISSLQLKFNRLVLWGGEGKKDQIKSGDSSNTPWASIMLGISCGCWGNMGEQDKVLP